MARRNQNGDHRPYFGFYEYTLNAWAAGISWEEFAVYSGYGAVPQFVQTRALNLWSGAEWAFDTVVTSAALHIEHARVVRELPKPGVKNDKTK
jgi:hypothetical protein